MSPVRQVLCRRVRTGACRSGVPRRRARCSRAAAVRAEGDQFAGAFVDRQTRAADDAQRRRAIEGEDVLDRDGNGGVGRADEHGGEQARDLGEAQRGGGFDGFGDAHRLERALERLGEIAGGVRDVACGARRERAGERDRMAAAERRGGGALVGELQCDRAFAGDKQRFAAVARGFDRAYREAADAHRIAAPERARWPVRRGSQRELGDERYVIRRAFPAAHGLVAAGGGGEGGDGRARPDMIEAAAAIGRGPVLARGSSTR